MPLLDVCVPVRFTAAMFFTDTPVKCQPVDAVDAVKHLKQMARQRSEGASGNGTG